MLFHCVFGSSSYSNDTASFKQSAPDFKKPRVVADSVVYPICLQCMNSISKDVSVETGRLK